MKRIKHPYASPRSVRLLRPLDQRMIKTSNRLGVPVTVLIRYGLETIAWEKINRQGLNPLNGGGLKPS